MPSRPCSEPLDTWPEMSSTVAATAPLRRKTTLPVFSATYRPSRMGMAASGWSSVASLVSLALATLLVGGAVADGGRAVVGVAVPAGRPAVAPGADDDGAPVEDEEDDEPVDEDDDDAPALDVEVVVRFVATLLPLCPHPAASTSTAVSTQARRRVTPDRCGTRRRSATGRRARRPRPARTRPGWARPARSAGPRSPRTPTPHRCRGRRRRTGRPGRGCACRGTRNRR